MRKISTKRKFGFVHLVDGTREAGYRGLTPHLPERVSHGSPAERDCTRPPGVRGCLQRAGVGLGPGAGGRGDPDAGPADGGGGAAGDGAERGAAVPELSPGAQPGVLVEPGAESAPAAGGGRGVRAGRWAGRGRAGRDDRASAGGEDRGEGDLPRPGAVEQEPLRQGQRAALDLDAGAGGDPVGRADLGPAVLDGAGPVGAVQRWSMAGGTRRCPSGGGR